MSTINLTVLIPHKNQPQLLQKCIDSIPQRNDVQVIVVDDNSDPKIVNFDAFPGLDNPMVEVYFTKEGKGAGYARNVGMKYIKGKWLTIIGSDDFYLPDFNRAIDEYIGADCDVIFFKCIGIMLDTKEVSSKGKSYNTCVDEAICSGDFTNALLFSGDAIKFYNMNFINKNHITFDEVMWGNDVVFMAQVALHAQKCIASDIVTYCTTESSSNLTKARSLESQFVRFIEECKNVHILRPRYGNVESIYYWLFRTWFNVYKLSKFKAIYYLPFAFKYGGIGFFKQLMKAKMCSWHYFMKFMKIFDKEWYFRKFKFVYSKFVSKKRVEQLQLKHNISLTYRATFGTKLHWHNPKTLNEKLIWLSWYWRNPLKTLCADKFKVREYVTKTCGLPETLLVPLLGVYNNADEIDFDALPNEFVLKCNHGCAYNILVKDKTSLDFKQTKETLNNWLSEQYSGGVAELHYDDIKPHLILCEQYLHNECQSDVNDYKVYCINGQPQWIVCCYDRDPIKQVAQLGTFDMNWNQLFYTKDETKVNIPKPKSLSKMVDYAKTLSQDFPLVRVDFYDIDGTPYLGELTFTPLGNMDTDYLPHINEMLGAKLELPQKYASIKVGGGK